MIDWRAPLQLRGLQHRPSLFKFALGDIFLQKRPSNTFFEVKK
jgi:hypothetical protein